MKITSIGSYGIVAIVSLVAGCSSFAANPTSQLPAGYKTESKQSSGLKDLYVANYEVGTIFLFKNDGYTPDGWIKTGVSGPWGVTLDRLGNLYVANADGANITEYAPGASTPSFTYSKGMISPRLVSVDSKGDVFETDFTGYDQDGSVSEFAQGSDLPMYSCSLFAPWAVATDPAGDVFVDYNVSQGSGGRIAEFKGGLAGCSPTELGAQVKKATGLVLDRNNNILIGDYYGGRIDVISPPYKKITRRLKTGGGPLFIAIDSANRKVFATVPNAYGDKVFVLNYATGDVEDKLGGGRRLDGAYGVVDAPNGGQ
jgi:DNA-binding beta-propeller fold protein YncE